MPTSTRVAQGSKSRGSLAYDINSEGISGSHVSYGNTFYAQGSNLRHIDQASSRLLYFVRSNTSNKLFINDKKVSDENFNDNLSPTKYYMGTIGHVESLIDHTIEKRDLGQSEIFNREAAFTEIQSPDDPVEIIKTAPENLFLPLTLVDPSSDAALDGVLEPFDARTLIDFSNSEVPFRTRGIRCTIGDDDPIRRSIVMEDGNNIDSPQAAPYLDSPEYFGPVELPAIFYEDNTALKPFSDTKNYQEIYFEVKQKKGVSVESSVVNAIQSGTFDTANALTFDFYGARGFEYFGTELDSIAFGGLKK